MDGSRFDRLTRTLATAAPRRRVVAGLVAGVFGGIGSRARDGVDAACTRTARPCATGGECCSGICTNGRCACAPGNEPCGGGCAPVCPPDQFRGSGCRCLCRATGRPPGPIGCPCAASSVCDGGEIVFCGGTQNDCLCDSTAGGGLVCSDFFAALDVPCASDADCPASHTCVTSFDCAQPYCALKCGSGGFARRSGVSPRVRNPEGETAP